MLSIAACAACPAAFAQPYVSANVGWASADFPIGAPFNGSSDDSAPTYGFDVGLAFTDKWAVELGWNGYGNFDGRGAPCEIGTVCTAVVTQETIDETVYEATLVRHFTLDKVRLYGKAGYYRAKVDTNIPFEPSDFTERGLVLGVGARWYFAAPWSLSLEATRFDDNVSQVSVGFGWGLGFRDRNRDDDDDDDRFDADRRDERN
jgi:hypothetical protein